ncbi:rho GTPase-activating protein gacZ-like [Tigriopus californicus]|uniref:rho GTPase-activating protein gacZ-like n=1 Tax=Tigriopus californicus TaxID=6832 RepID=UPI0027DA71B6|nr:rho GTPase-activating protein gacZ-like [Tigriopus californicus]
MESMAAGSSVSANMKGLLKRCVIVTVMSSIPVFAMQEHYQSFIHYNNHTGITGRSFGIFSDSGFSERQLVGSPIFVLGLVATLISTLFAMVVSNIVNANNGSLFPQAAEPQSNPSPPAPPSIVIRPASLQVSSSGVVVSGPSSTQTQTVIAPDSNNMNNGGPSPPSDPDNMNNGNPSPPSDQDNMNNGDPSPPSDPDNMNNGDPSPPSDQDNMNNGDPSPPSDLDNMNNGDPSPPSDPDNMNNGDPSPPSDPDNMNNGDPSPPSDPDNMNNGDPSPPDDSGGMDMEDPNNQEEQDTMDMEDPEVFSCITAEAYIMSMNCENFCKSIPGSTKYRVTKLDSPPTPACLCVKDCYESSLLDFDLIPLTDVATTLDTANNKLDESCIVRAVDMV